MSRRALLLAAVAVALGLVVAAAVVLVLPEDEAEPVTVADVRKGPAQLVVDGRPTLRLWVVTSDLDRAAGVNAHRLERGEGMWFGFDAPTTSSFWMQGVDYPLLIAWVGADQRVLSIDRMEPCPEPGAFCPTYDPPEPFRWAIELLPEDLEASGLAPGALVGMRP